MGLDIDNAYLNPQLKKLKHGVEREAGITTCDYALSVTANDDDAHQLAGELLEAIGLIPIRDDLPFACGHARDRRSAIYEKCVPCAVEADKKHKR